MRKTCTEVIYTGKRAGEECGRPAKATTTTHQHHCGTHQRAALSRGEEYLTTKTSAR